MDLLIHRYGHGAVALLVLAGACVPDLDTDESTVTKPRVLAVLAEPAEALPNRPVRYRALVADSSGARPDLAPLWFQCLAQKPLAELGPVSSDCLYVERGKLKAVGEGASVEATLPANACALFGPNPPQPMGNEPPGRPVDADETGGYKFPIVVGLNSGSAVDATLYEQRIQCGLAGVAPELSLDYALRYHVNSNPSVRELRVVHPGGSALTLAEGQPLEVALGERVEIEVAWPECPLSDQCGDGVCGPDESRLTCAGDCEPLKGCGGAERYLQFDRERVELVARRESMRLAWYATAGTFGDERTGVDADDATSLSKNTWTAPAQATSGTLWIVLRDARGGVGSSALTFVVR